MRKLIISALLVAGSGGGVLLSGVMTSSASPTCDPGGQTVPAGPLGNITVNPGSGTPSTSGTLQVCSEGSSVINGTATASGSGGSSGVGGYAIANGDSAQNPHGPTGYIGVEGGAGPSGGSAAVVGCSKGDYTTGYGTDSSDNDGDGPSTGNSDGYTQKTDGDSDDGTAPPNDGTTDANGNNVIVNSSGQGTATSNPSGIVTGGNCSLSNQPAP